MCPLADILYYNQVETTAFSTEEQNDLRDNHDPWRTMFHIPDRVSELPYISLLREPKAKQGNKEIHGANLSSQITRTENTRAQG